ncbi:hypothetical protein GPJ56_001512 [Histomonas meleagridis]|uniref:uncharacterized protein n=1 Tax=Histomonas meleagridis TaxID=135588 RepID=UPI00355A04A1|nr:hypothetical protein GPJ56_001512 [Histomonas meleagridis]KAH0807018.1 hypothetical protein GO595_000194 [Histomonas meleagridis]
MSGLTRSQGFSNLNQLSGAGSSTSNTGANSNTKSTSSFFSFNQQNNPTKKVDPLLQRLENIRKAYIPTESLFRFHTIALNAKGSSTTTSFSIGSIGSTKQQGCTEEEWNAAVQSAPEERTPFLLKGFDELNSRIEAQSKFASMLESSLTAISNKIDLIQSKLDNEFNSQIKSIQNTNKEISTKLMSVLKNKELAAVPELPFTKEESNLYHKIFQISEEMNQPNKYKAALNTLELKVTMLQDSKIYRPKINIPENDKIHIVNVLKMNTEAIRALSKATMQMDKQISSLEAAYLDLTSDNHFSDKKPQNK